jgi:hypothetical protein
MFSAALGLVIGPAELFFGDVAVIALELLLGHELQAEVAHLALAALAVLAGAVGARVHRGLGAAPDVLAHAAVDLVFLRMTLRHCLPCFDAARRGSLSASRSRVARWRG